MDNQEDEARRERIKKALSRHYDILGTDGAVKPTMAARATKHNSAYYQALLKRVGQNDRRFDCSDPG